MWGQKVIWARLSNTRAHGLPFTCRGRQPQNTSPNLTGIRILNKCNLGWSVHYHLPGKKCLSLRPLLFPMQLSSRISGNEKPFKYPQHHIFQTQTYLVSLLTYETLIVSITHLATLPPTPPRHGTPESGSWMQLWGSQSSQVWDRASSGSKTLYRGTRAS